MLLCRVTGTVTAPAKAEAFRPTRLLVVHPVDQHGAVRGRKVYVALDPHFGAGVGDVVLVAREGAALAQIMRSKSVPANAIVLAVVEDWSFVS